MHTLPLWTWFPPWGTSSQLTPTRAWSWPCSWLCFALDSVSLCPDVPTVFLRALQQRFQTLSASNSRATLWQATVSVMMQWSLWLRLHRAFDWPLWIEYSLSCASMLSPFGLLLHTCSRTAWHAVFFPASLCNILSQLVSVFFCQKPLAETWASNIMIIIMMMQNHAGHPEEQIHHQAQFRGFLAHLS